MLLSQDVSPGLPMVRADRRRIRQILLNLMSNATKFTHPGGNVHVSAHLSPEGMTICVADTGIGIAKEDIPKALERFGQVDSRLARKYQGTGLGLPLAKQLSELHGGTFDLKSAVRGRHDRHLHPAAGARHPDGRAAPPPPGRLEQRAAQIASATR